MNRKRIALIALIVLLVAFVGWRIYRLIVPADGGGRGFDRAPVAVEVDSVRTGPIDEVRLFTGSVHSLYRYVVAPKVSGRLLELRKRIGDYVQSGEVIARIDDAEYQQALLESEAALKIARASLAETRSQFDLAEKEFDRIRELSEQGLSSSSEVDAARQRYQAQKARLELARATVQQREASLETARIRLSYTTLRASEPGYVGERYVDEGALLSTNSAVVSVIGIDSVFVRTQVIERDYGRVEEGQAAQVSVDAFPGRRFQGKVLRIAPMLQEASRVAEMEVLVPNEQKTLKPGMFAKVHVTLASRDQTTIVPTKSVVTRAGSDGIFLVSDDSTEAQWVPVEVGIVAEERSEILSPEVSGLVITLGQHLLQDGSSILVPKAERDGDGASANGGSGEGA